MNSIKIKCYSLYQESDLKIHDLVIKINTQISHKNNKDIIGIDISHNILLLLNLDLKLSQLELGEASVHNLFQLEVELYNLDIDLDID